MRRIGLAVVSLGAVCLLDAQEASPDVARAESELRRVQELVDAGAAPRKKLDEARMAVDEARDHGVLRATLYGRVGLEEMTDEQSNAMLAAAGRILRRKQDAVEEGERMVKLEIRSRLTLTPLIEEMDRARRAVDAAESRARLFRELAAMAKAEQEFEAPPDPDAPTERRVAERFDGHGFVLPAHVRAVELAYEHEFKSALPVSARGETATHRAMGYDHSGRVDVGVAPDSREGVWLRKFLESLKVPYFAFRGAVPGQSTAAHIHIGPPSNRLRKAD